MCRKRISQEWMVYDQDVAGRRRIVFASIRMCLAGHVLMHGGKLCPRFDKVSQPLMRWPE